jgi:hypothetical protein
MVRHRSPQGSYGPSYTDLSRRAATYVDKILKGAKPADLRRAGEEVRIRDQPQSCQADRTHNSAPNVLARVDRVIR